MAVVIYPVQGYSEKEVRRNMWAAQKHGRPHVRCCWYRPFTALARDKMPAVRSFSTVKSLLNYFNNITGIDRKMDERNISRYSKWLSEDFLNRDGSNHNCKCTAPHPSHPQVTIHWGHQQIAASKSHRLSATDGTQSAFTISSILRRWKGFEMFPTLNYDKCLQWWLCQILWSGHCPVYM